MALLCSCGNRDAQVVLDGVGSFIQERPDSALKVLELFDRKDLNTRELQAQYSLLYTMSLDKNHIDTTDLSVILPASEYYSRHGSLNQKMRAYFYHGCIYANRKDDNSAMYYYLRALEDSARVDDNHYKELINSAISDVFSRNHNAEQELFYTGEALKYGKMAGDSVGVWVITGHLASCYSNLQMWVEAKNAYHEFFLMPVYDSVAYEKRRINYAKDLLRNPNPEPKNSIDIIESVVATSPWAMTVEAYCVYAYAQQLTGNSRVAYDIFKQLESIGADLDIVKLWRYRTLRKQGDYKQAIEDLERSVLVQDSIVLSTLRQSLVRTQRDYLKTETELLKREYEIERHRTIFVVIFFLVVLGVVTFLYFNRRMSFDRKMKELSTLYLESQRMLDLQNLKMSSVYDQLVEKDSNLLALKKQFAHMYKAQYKMLNDLCRAYLSPIKKDRKEVLYNEVMHQLEIIGKDKASQDKFISVVNNSLDGIIDKLRNDLPSHEEDDYRFLMFVIVGFDATTISCLTGHTVGTVYTKKTRLKTEISGLSSPYKDFYLQFIN